MNNKITGKRWLLLLFLSLFAGVITYLLLVKFVFKPDFKELLNVAWLILNNIGHPAMKFKAYVCLLFLIFPTLFIIIWWLMHSHKEMEEYGNAEFANLNNPETWEKMDLSKDKGLMLGCLVKKRLFRKEKRTFIRATRPLACMVVAPPGTGKTASIALPNLFSIENSCVVLDIKGELYDKTAGYRQQKFNNRILRFSPFSDDNTMFFNPFDNIAIKDLNFILRMKLAEQIASTIFVGEKGKETDHWLVSAKTLFTYFALYNMQKYNHTTLADLAQAHKKDYYNELKGDFLKEACEEDEYTGDLTRNYDKDTFKIFLKQVSHDEEVDELIRNQFRSWNATPDQEFGSIKSTYDTYMKIFANPQVSKSVSKMSFNYDDLRNEKITLYVVIDSGDIEVLAPLVRILIESLFKYLMTKENSDPNKFIYFILDEFVRFGKMPYLLEAPALCRSYGLVPIYITQSYEQIKKYYGDDDQKIIRANSAYQVIFRMNSPDDAKILSETVGDFTRQKISQSKGNLDMFKRNDSVSNEGYKLITTQDILSNPADQIYILIGGYYNRPIKAKVNMWFKNPEWKGADKIPLKIEEENKDEVENKEEESKNDEEAQSNQTQENDSTNESSEETTSQDENKEEQQEEKANNENDENKEEPKDINGFKSSGFRAKKL